MPQTPQVLLTELLAEAVFSSRLPELPSFRWMEGILLAGDSGCPWAAVGEGLASWDGAFFPDGSSLESDEGLLMPAMPPMGERPWK